MSFLQFDAEPPALTLEETLAFLETFDDAASTTESSSSSGGGSPNSGWDDDLDALYAATSASDSAATTAAGSSSSEPSWSDSDDASLLSLLLLPSPQHQTGTVAASDFSDDIMMTSASPQEPVAVALVTQQARQKRKAAPSAASSPRASAKADAPVSAETASAEPVKRRVRKQPKTEILRLRDQVEELQARLAQLQKTGTGALQPQQPQQRRSAAMAQKESERAKATAAASSTPSSSGPTTGTSTWLDSAVDQFKALQKSEALNRKLKSEVARQARLGKTLKSMFSKKTAQQGMEFLKELETAKPTQTVVRECGGFSQLKKLLPGHSQRVIEAATAEDLYKSVEKMQIETDSVRREIAAESDAGSVFSSSKIKHHQEFGPVFELKTNTPVGFPNFRELAMMFWERAANGMTEKGEEPVEVDRLPEHETLVASKLHERPISMTIKSQFGVLVLNGISVICRLEDMDRSVFTFASTLAVSGNRSMVFREHGWMIIMPHDTDDDKSVFQTFYRLDSEKRRNGASSALHQATAPNPAVDAPPAETTSLVDDDVTLRDIVMKALSDNMREFQNEIQNTLVNQPSAGFDTSKFPRSCPLHNIKVRMSGPRVREQTASS